MSDKPKVGVPALEQIGAVLERLQPAASAAASLGRVVAVADMVKAIRRNLDAWAPVWAVVETQSSEDQELIWDYLEEQYSDEALSLVTVLMAGKGGSHKEAGAMLLWLARYHRECMLAASGAPAAFVPQPNKNRDSYRSQGLDYVRALTGKKYRREYRAALVEEFKISETRANDWLKHWIDAGDFTPPPGFSDGGRPSKKNK